MTLASNFQRQTTVLLNRFTSREEVGRFLDVRAQGTVDALIEAKQASPRYRRFVDGVENAPNADVKLDGGRIEYLFSNMADAAAYALEYAVKRSPKGDSGDYARSWFFLVNGQPWTSADFTAIPPGAEVTLTNSQPYHRKIDVGGQRMSVPPQIIEATRQAVMRRYPGVEAERIFITFPAGMGYVLRGRAFRSGLVYDKKTKSYLQAYRKAATNRRDSRAGEQMTYPSLVMNELV